MAVLELPPEDGEHIGRYRIVRILGRGGMGEVLLALDPVLNRSVAIKRIRHDSNAPLLRQRLLQEAFAVGSLQHPAIVMVHDLLEDKGDDCIVMEYVPGRTLAETLKREPLEPALAVRLAKRVASGLAAAHEAGFIHRDLKTENVIVTPSGEAKILDFGLAKSLAADDPVLTLEGCVVGTCRSMSPEQARGGEVDERSDLFSLGVLLYEILTGTSPFQGANVPETLTKVTSEPPPCMDTLRPGLPPRLVALVYRLLEKAPDARPQSAGEGVRELEAISAFLSPSGGFDPNGTLSDLPTGENGRWGGMPTLPMSLPQAVPMPPPEALPPPKRRRTVVIAIVLSLLMFAAALILYEWYSRRLLRIVVPNPEVVGDNPQVQLAATSLLTTSLNTLALLRGIAPIDPSEIKGSPKTPTEIARAVAADDVLIIHIESAGNLELITLRYIQGKDGRDLWTDTLQMPLDQKDPLLWLRSGLDKKLQAHLPGHPQTIHPVEPPVSEEDYAAFLAIQQRVDKGQTPLEPELQPLREIIRRNPKFLDARLLAANVAINLSQSKRDPASIDLANHFVKRAEMCALQDPRPLQARFSLELANGQLKAAATALSQLEALRPDGPKNLALRAQLAEAQGNLKAALDDQKEAVDQLPSWTNLLALAKLEEKLGQVQDARSNLRKILVDSPGNIWARERLGELELDFGDPEAAERIYRDLISKTSTLQSLTNLGTALVFLDRYPEAISTFQEALAIAPDDVATTLNLADAEDASNHKDQADALYGKVLKQLKADHPKGDLSASDEMIEAQCLAHLGDTLNAKRIADRIVRLNPDDDTILQEAALVLTLAGDPRALSYIENARKKGVQPHWFKLPAFKPFFTDPRFQALVN